ncbi:MAG: hypothetical protein DMD74_09310 [Gemmatimonadetes bacterium]|nr:MAG: hypothetical protein DMD74_09310 [Gemmatimonadota bacterium]
MGRRHRQHAEQRGAARAIERAEIEHIGIARSPPGRGQPEHDAVLAPERDAHRAVAVGRRRRRIQENRPHRRTARLRLAPRLQRHVEWCDVGPQLRRIHPGDEPVPPRPRLGYAIRPEDHHPALGSGPAAYGIGESPKLVLGRQQGGGRSPFRQPPGLGDGVRQRRFKGARGPSDARFAQRHPAALDAPHLEHARDENAAEHEGGQRGETGSDRAPGARAHQRRRREDGRSPRDPGPRRRLRVQPLRCRDDRDGASDHDVSQPLRLKALVPDEVRAALAHDPRLLVPVGTCEQHGPHLPLGCDTIIVERLADDLSARFGILRAPTVEYGVNTATKVPYPGNAAVRRKTLHRWLNDLVGAWEQSGVETFVILTAHGHDPHQEALSTLRTSRARVFTVDVFALDFGAQLDDADGPVHGGELDTSLLLYIAPELVHMDRAQDFLLEGRARTRHQRGLTGPLPAVSPGSLGRPSLASREKGERLYKMIVERIAARVLNGGPQPV